MASRCIPDLTFHWHDISSEQIRSLAQWLKAGQLDNGEDGMIKELKLKGQEAKRVLEELIVEHRYNDGYVILNSDEAFTVLASLGALVENRIDISNFDKAWDAGKAPLALVNELSGIKIKAKAPTYIGARMGRPEKAKERAMEGSPNVLFPTGSFKVRSVSKQYRTLKSRGQEKTLNLELVRMRCVKCKKLGFSRRCDVCGERCVEERFCHKCGRSVESEIHCDMKTLPYDRRPVEIISLFEGIKDRLGAGEEEVKGVKGLSNASRIPERLEKGFLRAKHGVFVFRDGTSRFDATDVPLTHFTPSEVGLSVQKARELGYEKDYLGNPLENGDQLLSLRHQDIILAETGAAYFMRVAAFIDDMLVNLYGVKSFYNLKRKEDLISHLAIGLSPHTSAGALCRIIGFTKAMVGYGHPYFHTAKRRNCDGDEDCVMLLMDGLLNFSRKYLNEKRGGTMDTPLVLSMEINPKEVDDEAHNIEFVSRYPLEFYEAAERFAAPGEVKLKTVKDVLGTPEQFELPITHPGGSLDVGNTRTAYVLLNSIPEKIDIQFRLQERLRSVDKRDAAERLILSHFIPDLYGNLRSFSRQTFRCVSCNAIARRVPLSGTCSKCGGNLLLTINKGGIEKYLEISKDIVRRYELPDYLKQRLELVGREIKSIFEDDKIKQTGLSDFL